jgi:predicted PurR-regulated permease PerM
MNINATLLGQTIIILAIVFAVVGFYLGKRKTETPVLVSVLAFFSALMPPIGLIFLMVLAFKKDLPSAS